MARRARLPLANGQGEANARGNESFAAQVSAALGRRAAPGQPGRPRKRVETEVQNPFLT